MKTIAKIKNWFGNFILKEKLKKIIRIKHTYNVNSAATIDIVYDATNSHDYKIVKSFVDKLLLNKKKVKILGYVDAKIIPRQLYLINNFDFFCRKDKNLFNVPTKESVKEFINSKADIFIDLSLSEYFCVKYISSLKNASFKISRFTHENSSFDMMIDISKNNTVDYLIDQIIHYSNFIRSKEIVENGK